MSRVGCDIDEATSVVESVGSLEAGLCGLLAVNVRASSVAMHHRKM